MKRATLVVATLALLLADVGKAHSAFVVSTGYYDTPPGGFGPNALPLPDPWSGSPNTSFYGPNNPDKNAVLFKNTGASAITLQALNLGAGYDLLSQDNAGNAVAIQPGTYAIFAGVDGSELSFGNVNFTIDGQGYSFPDAVGPLFTNGVLKGNTTTGPPDETVSWTEIGPAVPEPASLSLLGIGIGVMAGYGWRRRKLAAA